MFIIDDIIGGVFSLGSAAIGADAQRKTAAKVLEAQRQQAFAHGSLEKTLLEIGVICVAGFAATFALVRLFKT